MNGPIRFSALSTELQNKFSENGKIHVFDWYLNNSASTGAGNQTWSKEYIDELVFKFNRNDIMKTSHIHHHNWESYPGASKMICEALDFIKGVKNKTVAVIGTEVPWIEAILINYGARVVTVEYNLPNCMDERIKTITYNDFVNSSLQFDCIVSYSSIEHSGLGRYGDPINPDADIETINNIYDKLTDKGYFLCGLPIGKDAISFNAHRIYGKYRLKKVFSKFKELRWFGHTNKLLDKPLENNGDQPVIVFSKKEL